MSDIQLLITMAMMVAGTAATRFITFICFPGGKEPPAAILYLGKALPCAVMALLVVYCLKDVSVFSGSHGLPELISLGVIVLLHLWKKNTLLSIGAGTVCYMLLVQFVF